MYFNRMKAYYERQSSGRYSIAGGVHGWVQVPFNEARYGRDFSGSIVCSNVWFLIRDGLAYWVQDELATGRSMASIQDELRSYDVEDRYDSDFDGNFREPDGFIDHFQIVHAGGDQAASDPSQGTDAIWSHRSQVGLETGPGVNPGVEVGRGGVSSGVTIPTNLTGMWVGDYSIQPENGGLGVFAHEYAHDLGLPDLYDTSGNTGGAENNTAFWTHSDDPANDQSGFNQLGGGITGTSTGWESMSVALPGSGSKLLRVRYRTDGAVVGLGFSIDDIAITGSAVDGAETGNEGWAYTRFERIDGVFKTLNPSVYIAEYKTHTGYDASLATAYNFGFLDSKPDWVETHPYAEGLLVNYWNGTYEDNNVGEHPGEGQLLPVDAHPTWFHASDGHLLRNRVLSFDSAFGLKPVPSITVHKNSQPTTMPAQAANPLFDDTVSYWSANDGHVGADGLHVGRYQPGWYSVRTPSSGTQIRVVDQSAGKMIVHVRPGR